MAAQVARAGDRAVAWVVCGEDIVFVGGSIAQGSRDVISEGSQAARYGDRVTLGCGRVGRITFRVARNTIVNGQRVALLGAGVTGPGIVKGWVIRAGRTVFAG